MIELDKILDFAAEKKVSDVHISAGNPVSYRVHGKIEHHGEVLKSSDIKDLSIKVLSQKEDLTLEEDRDLDFIYTTKHKHRFRCNAFHTREGLAFAFRLIPTIIPKFEELGLPNFVNEYVKSLKQGLVLLVGPTGHGKSTTMASLIASRADAKEEHFIMLEDPIEFIIKSSKSIVHQRSLGRDVSSFKRGLKMALREDPDVLMVGEMRDLETISAALTAAETGHVVFATLHTNSAPETINRVIDAFPQNQQSQIRSQLASSLAMVVSQRLMPSIDNKRVMGYEIMTTNYAIQNHIRQNTVFQIANAMQTDGSGGMVLFDQCLGNLVINNKIALETAFVNAHSQEHLKYILEMQGYKEGSLDQYIMAGRL